MTSFRATFELSIGEWEEGERRERNKRKRAARSDQGRTKGEWQLNKQRDEISKDVGRSFSFSKSEQKITSPTSYLFLRAVRSAAILFFVLRRFLLAASPAVLSLLSPSSQPPINRVSPNVALKLVTKPILFEPAEWSE